MPVVVGGRAVEVREPCQQFSQALFVFSLNQWENGPRHLAATSTSLFVPNTCCAFTVGSGLLSLSCLPSWVQQHSLSSPSFPLPTGRTLLLSQAAPLGQSLNYLSHSVDPHQHCTGRRKLVPNGRLGNLTFKWVPLSSGVLLFLKTAPKAACWALCFLGLHCCHWVWEDP